MVKSLGHTCRAFQQGVSEVLHRTIARVNDHAQVCTHSNPDVTFFALDALRQLAVNFLEKEELPHFKFQKDFLKPFEYTMIHNTNSHIREMVLFKLHSALSR